MEAQGEKKMAREYTQKVEGMVEERGWAESRQDEDG